jgi:ATP-dependent DNA helicase RecQ
MMRAADVDLKGLLAERFGHAAFRPGQERVIRCLLAGRDVLAVLPTGAGKSLVYQLAAQLLPGPTVVVSPLLALMKDQEDSIEARGVEVAVINSAQSEGESEEELRNVREGGAKLLYVTPERFDDDDFMAAMRGRGVSLFVVDEAHSISEWGHDFRPAYLGLGTAAARLGRPTLLALTATATPWVRNEIVERLELRDPAMVVRGTDRPNLFLEGRRVDSEAEERRVLESLLTGEPDEYPPELADRLAEAVRGCGIVYTATTRAAKETAEWLATWGVDADYYHGQRRKADRERVQEAFMAGRVRVIAATNAFGLGVDKPDVRFVIHRDVPASVEAYYQEAGRAGRDGDFARCTLIYRPADLGRAAFLAGGGQLSREDVVRARKGLLATRAGTMRQLGEATGLSRGDLTRAIELLERHGIVAEKRGRVRLLVDDFDPEQVSLEREEHRRAYERSRLEMMRGYAELRECRRRYILNYFGEEYESERCAMCDQDAHAGSARPGDPVDSKIPAGPFAVNDRVAHDSWGEGTVQRVTRDSLTVLFDTVGYKMLARDTVEQKTLLEKVE